MRSRSSRLFVVLLHLVGISKNFPQNLYSNNGSITSVLLWNVGIVGVNPHSILSETLNLSLLHTPTKKDDQVEKYLEYMLSEPYWLQDSSDHKCLGPTGFLSECGDATLWWVLRRKARRKKRRKKSGFWGKCLLFCESDDSGDTQRYDYALRFTDIANMQAAISPHDVTKKSGIKRSILKGTNSDECLIVASSNRRKKDKNNSSDLKIVPCSNKHAYSWNINEQGHLVSKSFVQQRRNDVVEDMKDENKNSICLYRSQDSTEIHTMPCESKLKSSQTKFDEDAAKLVEFSLVRFQSPGSSATVISPPLYPNFEDLQQPEVSKNGLSLDGTAGNNDKSLNVNTSSKTQAVESSQEDCSDKSSAQCSLGHTKTMSQAHASEQFHDYNSLQSLPLISLSSSHDSSRRRQVLHNSNPTLIGVNGPVKYSQQLKQERKLNRKLPKPPIAKPKIATLSSPPSISLSGINKSPTRIGSAPTKSPNIQQDRMIDRSVHDRRPTVSPSISTSAVPKKALKIPKNPYIEEAIDNWWLDPQTGLKYRTDLCKYLGHEKKRSGRHTLMGVGQYTRTVFNIKVYGIAVYVAKRDVLASPRAAKFASLDADQLRQRPDFYEMLMEMTPDSAFDRTIMLQLNMQLTTDTMRSSLESDWKFLTGEHKMMLINSSLDPRPADAKMLEKIKTKENTSNCSCGQVAPPEYAADSSCCARGTELVFTWRKNLGLEVRLDGRLMDTFQDPALAKGIFFEYFREDDPMSVDARERLADGFPFLLAPLGQVRGVSMGHSAESNSNTHEQPPGRNRFGLNFVGSLFGGPLSFVQHGIGHVGNGISGTVSFVQDGLGQTGNGIAGAARFVDRNMKESGANFNHHREQFARQLGLFSTNSMLFVADNVPLVPENWKEHLHRKRTLHARNGNITVFVDQDIHYVSGGFTDEMGVIKIPEMSFTHKLYFTIVHLYLVLLLIVSLPGSQGTKLIMKRASVPGCYRSNREMEYDRIDNNDNMERNDQIWPLSKDANYSPTNNNSGVKMRKSFSYCL